MWNGEWSEEKKKIHLRNEIKDVKEFFVFNQDSTQTFVFVREIKVSCVASGVRESLKKHSLPSNFSYFVQRCTAFPCVGATKNRFSYYFLRHFSTISSDWFSPCFSFACNPRKQNNKNIARFSWWSPKWFDGFLVSFLLLFISLFEMLKYEEELSRLQHQQSLNYFFSVVRSCRLSSAVNESGCFLCFFHFVSKKISIK